MEDYIDEVWDTDDEDLYEMEAMEAPLPSFMKFVRGSSRMGPTPQAAMIAEVFKREQRETVEARAARVRVSELSDKARMVYAQARDVIEEKYDVHYEDSVCCTVGVADLAINTPIVFHAASADPDLIVNVGHVGAITAKQSDLSNLSVWNGDEFVTVSGNGSFCVHAVSAKIDGYPIVPVRVMSKMQINDYCWIFEKTHYVLRPSSVFFEGRAELKNGTVYASHCKVDSVVIGTVEYPVLLSPVVAPTEMDQVLLYASISDGLILHSGVKEYKLKYCTTVDLMVRDGHATTSDGIVVMETSLPCGVYEFDLHTHAMIRGRPDRSTGNSSMTLSQLARSANVYTFMKMMRVTGVQVCDSLDSHLLYTGEGIQTGVLRSVQSRWCTWVENCKAYEIPFDMRVHLKGREYESIFFVKRLMVLQGFTIVHDRVERVEEILPRRPPDKEDYGNSWQFDCKWGEGMMPFPDFGDYDYLDPKYDKSVNGAMSLVMKTVREGRK